MHKSEELKAILIKHTARYPKMEPTDAVKLIYQNEFGGGHMIENEIACQKYLEKEFEELLPTETTSALPVTEQIGNHLARLYLVGLDSSSFPLSLVGNMFLATSHMIQGSKEAFREKLDLLQDLVEKNYFQNCPFLSAKALKTYLQDYEAKGYPAVHHSKTYRDAYHPAYRIIHEHYIRLFPIITKISALLEKKKPLIIGIDGNAASGKSTMAKLIASLFPATIIPMDDFFLPKELRTQERFLEPGGNIHYERFLAEVVEPIRKRQFPFSYFPFDCSNMNFGPKKEISNASLIIIEGAYSHHPFFAKGLYDYSIFSSLSEKEQLKRIQDRNGEAMLEKFKELWIPMENQYFNTYPIKECCDIIL